MSVPVFVALFAALLSLIISSKALSDESPQFELPSVIEENTDSKSKGDKSYVFPTIVGLTVAAGWVGLNQLLPKNGKKVQNILGWIPISLLLYLLPLGVYEDLSDWKPSESAFLSITGIVVGAALVSSAVYGSRDKSDRRMLYEATAHGLYLGAYFGFVASF
ncbi:MAG: hypothetical protein HRU19_02005 [Pseudobacteriovorax sp.]|nr:hypothetical protein [Pseudobacteriovorax sp.]